MVSYPLLDCHLRTLELCASTHATNGRMFSCFLPIYRSSWNSERRWEESVQRKPNTKEGLRVSLTLLHNFILNFLHIIFLLYFPSI